MGRLFDCLNGVSAGSRCQLANVRFAGRVLYSVSHSYPFSSNGYAVRTHGVAVGLMQAGCDVIAVSRPGVPWDHRGFECAEVPLTHSIDGIRYVHSRSPSRKDGTLEQYVERAVPVLTELARVFKPSVVMAASNWHNALPAALAARQLGLPFFYEVRGFWEISQATRDRSWAGSPGFEREVAGETAVAMAAQRVFTINRLMRDELVRRGVPAARVELVPNGFPGWAHVAPAPVSRAELGLRARHVVGYIGSFSAYEGLENLIKAMALLRQRGIDVSVLLVGSGEMRGFAAGDGDPGCPATAAYRQLAERLGVSDHLSMPGRVPPDMTAAYYELLDVVVIPRLPLQVCELVSPMKPLEAAAHGKRVLMSDVGALAELAGVCPNFSFFAKGEVASMVERLAALLAEPVSNLPRSEALLQYTWEKNVASMAAAIKACGPARGHRPS